MKNAYNVYCDESCHLEKDRQPLMVLGAVWCPLDKSHEIAVRLREIKVRHRFKPTFEIKWTKVSPAQQAFYIDVLDYFFDDDDLHFRALIAPEKAKLRHADFGQDHETWYYKMYFEMLKVLLSPDERYLIYLDIKDSRSASKIVKLHEVLCHNILDFQREIIARIQPVHSHEVEQVQLVDLLIGIVSYANRGLHTNAAKVALVDRMRRRSRYSLTQTTLLLEQKVNLLRWQASEMQA